jgi:acyl carrier protein
MYILSECPHCKTPYIESIVIEGIEEQRFSNEEAALNYILKNIKVKNTLRIENIKHIIPVFEKYIKDGITIAEIREILTEKFGVASVCHFEVIWEIEGELGMVCPDHKTLRFVSPQIQT